MLQFFRKIEDILIFNEKNEAHNIISHKLICMQRKKKQKQPLLLTYTYLGFICQQCQQQGTVKTILLSSYVLL